MQIFYNHAIKMSNCKYFSLPVHNQEDQNGSGTYAVKVKRLFLSTTRHSFISECGHEIFISVTLHYIQFREIQRICGSTNCIVSRLLSPSNRGRQDKGLFQRRFFSCWQYKAEQRVTNETRTSVRFCWDIFSFVWYVIR